VIRPLVIWLESHKYPVEEVLKKADLSAVLNNPGDMLIPTWSAMQLLHYMVDKEGPDLPLRVVEDDDCFKPVRDMLVPGARTVESALRTAIDAVPFHFSHLEIGACSERSGNLKIRGIVHGNWHSNHIHELEIYLAAIIQKLCRECAPQELNVFERVELTRHSRGLTHLQKAHFGKIIERSGHQFIVSVRKDIARRVYSLGVLSAKPMQLKCYKVPKSDPLSISLAVGERMEGLVTKKRIAKAFRTSWRTFERQSSDAGNIPALILYNKEQNECGKPGVDWTPSAQSTVHLRQIFLMQISTATTRWAAFCKSQRRRNKNSKTH
jgi:hypothetical protein